MRSKVARLVVVALFAAAAVVSPASGAAAQTLVPGVMDLTVAVESMPETVSPPGGLVVYRVTVTNAGVLPSAFSVALQADPGFQHRADLSSTGCSGSGHAVTCSGASLPAGSSSGIDVVGHTPAHTGTYTATARVAATGLLSSLEYSSNNTDETVTDVVDGDGHSQLVEGGSSVTLHAPGGREYVLSVPETIPGVIVALQPKAGAGHICGDVACEDGFHTDFVDHPRFRADDPANPLVTLKTFGPKDPCQGLGTSKCAGIYFAKDPDAATLEPMPFCPGHEGGSSTGSGVADPAPCVNRIFKVQGATWFDVRMLSTDPIELPPVLKGLVG